MSKALTRRTILTATAASAAIAVPASAFAAIPAPDPIVALGAAERAAYTEWLRALGERDDAEGRHQLIGSPRAEVGGRSYYTPESLRERLEDYSKLPNNITQHSEFMEAMRKDAAPMVASRVNKLRDEIAAYEKARNEAGIPALQVAEDAASAKRWALVEETFATPAQSFEGIAVKLVILEEDMDFGKAPRQMEMVASILADAKRLAGGAA